MNEGPVLDRERSIENVRVMLYSAISMLCGSRGIFHTSSYEETEFVDDEELYTFEGLLTGAHPSKAPPSSPLSTASGRSGPNFLTVPLLKRGRGERSDLCLSMLDTVFEALHRNALHSLCVGFVEDPENPRLLLEQYKFNIKYRESKDNNREVEGLQCQYESKDNDAYARILDIKRLDVALLGRLYDLCDDMAPLPSTRYMNVAIRYTDDDWDPDGFSRSTIPLEMMQEVRDCHIQEKILGLSGSILHDMCLKVKYFKPDQALNGCLSQDLHLNIPEENSESPLSLMNTKKDSEDNALLNQHSDLDKRMELRSIESPVNLTIVDDDPSDTASQSTRDRNSSPEFDVMSSPSLRDSNISAASPARQKVVRKPAAEPAGEISHSTNTSNSQAAEDERVKDALHNMLNPSHNAGDALETQLRTNTGQLSEDQEVPSPDFDEHMASYDFLGEKKAFQLWDFKDKLQRNLPPPTDSANEFLQCQCQSHEATNETVRCTICSTLQHALCYGFALEAYPHVCWNCLLLGERNKHRLIQRLGSVALQRQAMNVLLNERAIDKSTLARRIAGPDSSEGASLVTNLLADSYAIERGGRTRMKSSARLEIPEAADDPEYLAKLDYLFSSFKLVQDHYSEVARAGSSVRVRQALISQYPALSQTFHKEARPHPKQLKRQMGITGQSENGSQDGNEDSPRKRVRSNESSNSAPSTGVITPRRSQRTIKLTPKMKEANFNFLINARSIASGQKSATKSVRVKWD